MFHRVFYATIFQVLTEDGEVSHFIDGKNETPRNWMCFVNCARNEQEQNLEVFQYGNSIYYRATKDIPPEQELLVWYGPSYAQFLGIPGIPPIIERPRRRRNYEGIAYFHLLKFHLLLQDQAFMSKHGHMSQCFLVQGALNWKFLFKALTVKHISTNLTVVA